MWPVSNAAKNASPSDRIETLAGAKSYHKEFQPEKPVFTIISKAAKNGEASTRIETLARSKQYAELPIKPNSGWDWGEWQSDIPAAAMNGEASDRVTFLATPKALHRSYHKGKPTIWNVSEPAKKTLPSLRLQKLARPKSRSQYEEDYDENFHKVSVSAKSNTASPRILELCTPIPRKVRQKKIIIPAER